MRIGRLEGRVLAVLRRVLRGEQPERKQETPPPAIHGC
jgi:hypothetical protein